MATKADGYRENLEELLGFLATFKDDLVSKKDGRHCKQSRVDE